MSFEIFHEKKIYEEPICQYYQNFALANGIFIAQAYSYIIVIFSSLIRKLFLYVAGLQKFNKHTSETSYMMISIFIISFIIYGIVPLAATWDARGRQT